MTPALASKASAIEPLRIAQTFGYVKLYFGEVLHLAFLRDEVVALQTWRVTRNSKLCVELTMRDGACVTCEYDSREKWAEVIALLDGVIE